MVTHSLKERRQPLGIGLPELIVLAAVAVVSVMGLVVWRATNASVSDKVDSKPCQ
jgi:hypothetical protein